MADRVLLAFTVEGEELIQARGWSGYYPVNQARAKQFQYIVFCQNLNKSEAMKTKWDFATATKPHATGFMLAKIADVVPANQLDPSPHVADRWIFTLSEFAKIDLPNLWEEWRYPVNYEHTLQDLGLDPATLQFEPMPSPRAVEMPDPTQQTAKASDSSAVAASMCRDEGNEESIAYALAILRRHGISSISLR